MPHDFRIAKMERLIRRDPCRRGLISTEWQHGALCLGHLELAAAHLAQHATRVAIVTGFYVPFGEPPCCETDGPPGAMLLATALRGLGVETMIVTDTLCLGGVRACADAAGIPKESVIAYPDDATDWIDEFFEQGFGRGLSHLIAVERVGPSHTLESLNAQTRATESPTELFLSNVPSEAHGRHHNMRGEDIGRYTADTHRLFEAAASRVPAAKTIGIGDGANEIGMGAIPWEDLYSRLSGEHRGRIPCRIATDWTIIAGTSNWGAAALAAATLVLRDAAHVIRDIDEQREHSVLKHMVEHGPAVDGITGRREATVDGLPFVTYVQTWKGIRELLGLTDSVDNS